MSNENLVKYIKDGLGQGRSEDVIRPVLLSNGWAQKDIDDAFNFVKAGATTAPASVQSFGSTATPSNSSVSRGNLLTTSSSQKGKGRMGRLRYFIWVVIIAIVSTAGSYALLFFIPDFFLSAGLSILLYIAILIVSAYVAVKRFHDLNKSGWYVLALIVPIYDIYLTVELLLQCGTEGPNRYGDDLLSLTKNHNDFANRLGSSIIFKIIVAILLSAVYLVVSLSNYTIQKQTEQQIDQSIVNSLIASSTNATTSPTNIASSTVIGTTSSTQVPTSNNRISNADSSQTSGGTSSWQTASLSFFQNNLCWNIKYPPSLYPIAANGGYEDIEYFIDTSTITQSSAGLVLQAVFNGQYSQINTTGASVTPFTTISGANGEILSDGTGRWMIYIQANENNQSFYFVLRTYSAGGYTPPYDLPTAETMAKSMTFSCPASAQ
jgi:uncharacterized membrane protein YhaH (DUF805 family)